MMKASSTRKILISCAVLFFQLAAENEQFGLDPVLPSVTHGICTLCNTSSCVNCYKCSAGPCHEDRDDESLKTCSLCSNKSYFCLPGASDTHGAIECTNQNNLSRCCLGCEAPRSVFIPRSVGANTARELAGWEEFIYQYDVGDYYLTTGTVLGYSHSIHPNRITRALFGTDVLYFAGSQVLDRSPCTLLADNFGLSTTFRGSLRFHPTIENIFLDNQFFIGLDPWCCGLYARIHAPLVHTRWNLGMRQTIESAEQECTPFPPCYMAGIAAGQVPASCNIIEALSGNFTFGEMQQRWCYGRFVCGPQTKTALADIDLILGYNRWQSDFYHLGFYGQLVVPTGTKFTAHDIFEPIVGNTRHWELGIGMSGHLIVWERDADQSLAVYFEGNMTHLFKNRQMRSFDFCGNGLLSRYMLLKEFEPVGTGFAYTGNLINGINFATRPVDVSVALKGDVSAKLSYRSPCFIVDLGYNFYGITQEKVHILSCDYTKLYGIKGTEGVCDLEYATEGTPLSFGPLVRTISSNATEHCATIRTGAKTDNAESFAAESPSNIVVSPLSRQTGVIEGPGVRRAFNSNPPIFVSACDLHKETGVMPAQATHKVFGYLGYNFYESDWCYNPYLGLGGELELDARACSQHTALNQWSVWLKGGFEF